MTMRVLRITELVFSRMPLNWDVSDDVYLLARLRLGGLGRPKSKAPFPIQPINYFNYQTT